MRFKQLIFLTSCVFGSSFLLFKCANQLPPSGGDVDKTPPVIIRTFPENNTVNFKEDYIEIEFSEYVDKRSVRDAIFISPIIEQQPDYSWTGTTLTISFPSSFKADVTYTITIGTDVVDLNNGNRMASSFTFAFSTGEKIDKKIISGKVYDKEDAGIFIFAYKLNESNIDSLLYHKPDYVTQTGKDGIFSLQGLASASYRVFAVKDKYKDLMYDFDNDEIGIPYKDVSLNDPDSVFSNLYFKISATDTIPPRVIKAMMTDKYHILTTFSEVVDSSSKLADNFELIDSTAGKTYKINYSYKGNTKPEEYVIINENEIPVTNRVFLKAKKIIDLSGNETSADLVLVTLSEKPDTSAVVIFSSEPKNNGIINFNNPEITIYFTDYFMNIENEKAVEFTDTLGNKIFFDLKVGTDANLVITPKNNFRQDKNYRLKIDLNFFRDLAGNSIDSVYVFNFKSSNNLDLTGISGKILNPDLLSNIVIVLESFDSGNRIYQLNINSASFEFKNVSPGTYKLWCYSDKNENAKFDYGWPHPIRFAERFFYYPDSLNLRPRWEITDINFELK